MSEIELDGQTVSWLRRESEGPPLVLVHGAGACARVWSEMARELTAFDLVAPSLPGRESTAGDAFDRAEDAAAWVDRLLAMLDGPPAIVLGHSYGGAIAIELALRSTRVAGLVLVSSGARLRVHESILDAAARAIEERSPMSMGFAFLPNTDEARARYAEATRDTPPEATLQDWRACDAFDRLDAIASIQVPVLVVGGTEDALTPPKYQRGLAERLPRAQLELLEGAGHMLAFTRTRELAVRVRAWAGAVVP